MEPAVKIGFTGTREGYSPHAHKALVGLLLNMAVSEFHHGCCIGADTQAHRYVVGNALTIGYPGPNDDQRGVFDDELDEVRMRETSFFARNRSIVNAVDVMIATPRYMWEEDKGGTWYSIRYARKVGKTLYIVWPDGSVTS